MNEAGAGGVNVGVEAEAEAEAEAARLESAGGNQRESDVHNSKDEGPFWCVACFQAVEDRDTSSQYADSISKLRRGGTFVAPRGTPNVRSTSLERCHSTRWRLPTRARLSGWIALSLHNTLASKRRLQERWLCSGDESVAFARYRLVRHHRGFSSQLRPFVLTLYCRCHTV